MTASTFSPFISAFDDLRLARPETVIAEGVFQNVAGGVEGGHCDAQERLAESGKRATLSLQPWLGNSREHCSSAPVFPLPLTPLPQGEGASCADIRRTKKPPLPAGGEGWGEAAGRLARSNWPTGAVLG